MNYFDGEVRHAAHDLWPEYFRPIPRRGAWGSDGHAARLRSGRAQSESRSIHARGSRSAERARPGAGRWGAPGQRLQDATHPGDQARRGQSRTTCTRTPASPSPRPECARHHCDKRDQRAIIVLVQDSTNASRWHAAGWALRLPLRSARTPHPERTAKALTQTAKGLVAALLSWQITALWLPGQQQYLAVATALLMVHAPTIHRTVTQAVRSVTTRAAGLLLAAIVVRLLGTAVASLVVIVAVSLVAGSRRRSDDRLQIVSTAVLALAVTATAPVGHVVVPVLATLAGAAVGTAVNALIFPPLHLDASGASVRDLAAAMGSLLGDMGRGLRERRHTDHAHAWLEQGRHLEELVAQAHEDVRRGKESLRWNTRCAVRGRDAAPAHSELLRALHGVSFQVRGIARTLADNVDDRHTGHHLGRLFLHRYATTLEAAGQAVTSFAVPASAAGSDGAHAREKLRRGIGEATAWHSTMTDLIAHGTLPEPGAWHVYGSLMTDVERLLADLDHADQFTTAASAPQPRTTPLPARSEVGLDRVGPEA
jgi:hypothetical protein